MRMLQSRNRVRFALESLAPFRVGRKIRWEHLNGNDARKLRIAGAIDFAHAAGADQTSNLVAP